MVEEPSARPEDMWPEGVFCDIAATASPSGESATADRWQEYEQTFLDEEALEARFSTVEDSSEEDEPCFPAEKPL
jgi:hypothetical protein